MRRCGGVLGTTGDQLLSTRTLVVALALVLLAGCATATQTPTLLPPSPTPAPTATATPTASASPSATPTATATATATATPTATATSTATATTTPTATATPTPTPTPTPIVLSQLADFEGRNPLTGEVVEDPAVLARRPLSVKISNSPAHWVRPQAGLSQADLVFEHLTEGDITRFHAIFYDEVPPKVGPIRSARMFDLEIPAMYDSGLVFSGASLGVTERLYGSDLFPQLVLSWEEGYYRTGEDKPFEHTLYGDLDGFRQALAYRGQNYPPELTNSMAFHSDPPAGGEPGGGVTVRYGDWTTATWRYDGDLGRYLRWSDGEVHTDTNTAEQLSAANVVLLYAHHEIDRSICEQQFYDPLCLIGAVVVELEGQGPATLLRDGLAYHGEWRRTRRWSMLTFYDQSGASLPLQIGPTWFQMVPLPGFYVPVYVTLPEP